MGRKTIGIVIVFVGVVMLSGFAYFLFFSQTSLTDKLAEFTGGADQPAEAPAAAGNDQPAEAPAAVKRIVVEEKNSNEPSEQSVDQKSETGTAKDSVARMAASFAERFGSYSNQSNFSNIIDLKIFMSIRMQAWGDDYVRSQRLEKKANDIYFGITTKAIAQEVREYDDHIGRSEVLVSTRRREAINSTANVSNVFNQDIIIDFVREKGAWKVDSASWQAKP